MSKKKKTWKKLVRFFGDCNYLIEAEGYLIEDSANNVIFHKGNLFLVNHITKEISYDFEKNYVLIKKSDIENDDFRTSLHYLNVQNWEFYTTEGRDIEYLIANVEKEVDDND